MRVLVLSAYDAESHRYWREGLDAYCSNYDFTHLSLPPRHFSWRIRGNSLSWAFGQQKTLAATYDLVLATSLVDLSALRGFVPSLGQLPTLVYFHENQFAYPPSADRHGSVEPQMVNLYTALCADRLLFNSRWNLDSFLDGVETLLSRMPDCVPEGLVERLAVRAEVLAVPVDNPGNVSHQPDRSLDIVWNHRWEYDKGPAILLAAVQSCVERALPVRFHLLGQQFRRRPREFEQLLALLQANPSLVGHCGYVDERGDYLVALESADIVLSTALHEFQGLSVLEAMGRGCLPLVPDRLSYPEFVPAAFRYRSSPDKPVLEGRAIADRLAGLIELAVAGSWPSVPNVESFAWAVLGPRYRRVMEQCIDGALRCDRQ